MKRVENIFDAVAANYEQELAQGLALTGQNSAFYARERIYTLYTLLSSRFRDRVRRILDFGCGTGGSRNYFYERWPDADYVGCDPSESSLEVAATRYRQPKTTWTTSTAGLDKFDLVFTNGVFHHILPENRASALTLIRSVMNPTGLFAFFENNPWNPGTLYIMSRVTFDRDATTISPSMGRRLLEGQGFNPICFSSLFYFPSAFGLLRPLEKWLRQVPLGGQYLYLCSLQ